MKSKHILIVGGTGFIGYHLAKFLLKKKYLITSLSTKNPPKRRKLKKVIYIKEDINKIRKIIKIKDKFKYVINVAGYVDHTNKKLTYNSHFKGCANLVKIFRDTKIDSFLQVGSSLEYGKLSSPQYENDGLKPISYYGKSKFLATKFLLKNFRTHKFPVIIIRAYQVYGPRQDSNRLVPFVITNCLNNNSFFCSEGSQLRDFLYIDDFIFAIYKALKCKNAVGSIINIGYGKPHKVKDIINKIKNIIKKGKPLFNKIKLRKDENKILFPSISKASKILKWKPKISFTNGIKKTILDYKKITL
jgi:UDP-glucose 4-epimerase|tara:strand:+ start:369 stop:1274 length:906 start_codon:yes stop_codon:yes gene_type:complete